MLFDLQRDPDLPTLRRFGAIAFGVFGVLAVCAFRELLWFAHGLGALRVVVSASLLAVGVCAGLSSIVYPRANRGLYVTLSLLAYPLGFVLSYCVLWLLFFGVLTPLAFVLRAMHRDPLARTLQRAAPTYWVTARAAQPRSRYFRQF